MKDNSLNKTVATFVLDGKRYEIDLLLDGSHGKWNTYDIFQGNGKFANFVGQFESPIKTTKKDLIKLAKIEIIIRGNEDE